MELYSVRAEENIIEALLSKRVGLLDKIKLDYFYNPKNRAIVKAIKDLYTKDIGIDYTTVVEQINNNASIKDKKEMEKLILGILGNTISTNIEGNIKMLKDLYKRRTTIDTLQNAINRLQDVDSHIDSINTSIASQIDLLTLEDATIDDSTPCIIDRLEKDLKSKGDGQQSKYKYGVDQLDKWTWGLHNEELTTIAAKSGVGKTALALQIASNLLRSGLKVLIISREMSDIQIFKRILVSYTAIDSRKFRSKTFTKDEWNKVNYHMKILKNSHNLYVNTQISTVTEIKKRIRQIHPDIVIIDYLQLLTPEKSEGNREREVATISREIKGMTSDFKIPIIQLSQINDEFGDDRPYGERAMRESKSIYQNSNNVIYIHKANKKELREHIDNDLLYIDQIRTSKESGNDIVEIILDKQRDGTTGIFLQEYVKKNLRFSPLDNVK